MLFTQNQAVIKCTYSSLILEQSFPDGGLWGKFKHWREKKYPNIDVIISKEAFWKPQCCHAVNTTLSQFSDCSRFLMKSLQSHHELMKELCWNQHQEFMEPLLYHYGVITKWSQSYHGAVVRTLSQHWDMESRGDYHRVVTVSPQLSQNDLRIMTLSYTLCVQFTNKSQDDPGDSLES